MGCRCKFSGVLRITSESKLCLVTSFTVSQARFGRFWFQPFWVVFTLMHDFQYVRQKLYCEGVSIESLVRKFGTPLYVYSQKTLTEHYQKLDRALSPSII